MVWIHNVRILAVFAVIIVHTAASVVLQSSFSSEFWWAGNLWDSSARWSVPVFVMISGALLLTGGHSETLLGFYQKRLSKILWPLVFWTIFYLIWSQIIPRPLATTHPSRNPYLAMAIQLATGQSYYHLWFLYMIVGLYVFTPIFRVIVEHVTKAELVFFVALTFIFALINSLAELIKFTGSHQSFVRFISYIPYFFMGEIVRRYDLVHYKNGLLSLLGASLVATAFGCFWLSKTAGLETGLYFYDYLSITVVPMSISLMFLLKKWDMPIISEGFTKALSGLTFGIYLAHPVVLDILSLFGVSGGTFSPIICIPLVSILTFTISAVAVFILTKLPYLKYVV